MAENRVWSALGLIAFNPHFNNSMRWVFGDFLIAEDLELAK